MNSSLALEPCTFPARPLNGGSLELALPKPGRWEYEPKYNGWRTLVHGPTGTMFNRRGQRLTIAGEFTAALTMLRSVVLTDETGAVEWFDCEALERRHGLGRGTLLVFDYIMPIAAGAPAEPYWQRKQRLARALPPHEYTASPQPDSVYNVPSFSPEETKPLELYRCLQQLNRQWCCPFYEGLVAKRAESFYPVQLRSPDTEFPGWVKHRWA